MEKLWINRACDLAVQVFHMPSTPSSTVHPQLDIAQTVMYICFPNFSPYPQTLLEQTGNIDHINIPGYRKIRHHLMFSDLCITDRVIKIKPICLYNL